MARHRNLSTLVFLIALCLAPLTASAATVHIDGDRRDRRFDGFSFSQRDHDFDDRRLFRGDDDVRAFDRDDDREFLLHDLADLHSRHDRDDHRHRHHHDWDRHEWERHHHGHGRDGDDISPVPLPPSVVVFGLGLAGLALSARRRHKMATKRV